jgi:hypothetical protein
MKSKRLALVLAGLCSVALAAGNGCSKKSESSTSTGTTTPSNLSQSNIDDATANNIINAVIDIYNQNVAGRSQGAYNGVTVTCPNGGTALISGIATKDNSSQLTTTDLSYTMTACKEAQTNHTLTYTGVVTQKGSFNLSTNFVSETIKASGNVTMAGTITYTGYNTATVDQTGTFTVNRGYNVASGDILGRSFSY